MTEFRSHIGIQALDPPNLNEDNRGLCHCVHMLNTTILNICIFFIEIYIYYSLKHVLFDCVEVADFR